MSNIDKAVQILKKGDIIAYPTEAVYGLGCDPLNEKAVIRLLQLKHRNVSKGLILIAASWEQLKPYVTPLSEETLARILPTWPGPTTWLLPASPKTPEWIKGNHNSVAVRVTNHPTARQLCEGFCAPITSTSANLSDQAPAKTADEVKTIFGDSTYLVMGEIGALDNPTEIKDGLTNETIRHG